MKKSYVVVLKLEHIRSLDLVCIDSGWAKRSRLKTIIIYNNNNNMKIRKILFFIEALF